MTGTGFSSLNTALTGLSGAQRALDATSQNIVNSNTPGYSRQRVLLESIGANPSASFHSGHDVVAGGVRIADVVRIHDAFTEATRAAAGAKQSALGARLDTLETTQQLMAEPGENGLQATLDSFYRTWHDVASNPVDDASKEAVIQKGLKVVERLHYLADGLAAQWTTEHADLTDLVAQVNQAAQDLAAVNRSIGEGETIGQPVNEMMDKRDVLVRQLAGLVGGSAQTDDQGRVSININGISIVSGTTYTTMGVVGAQDLSASTLIPPGLAVNGYDVPITSGAAAGILAGLRSDLPDTSKAVDTIARSLVSAVNDVYQNGYAADGTSGHQFFAGTDARSIDVVATTPAALAIRSGAATIDGAVAGLVGDLADDATTAAHLGGAAGASEQWRSLVSVVGIQAQSLKTGKAVQDSVVAAAEDAVQSDAGVNLDEEMTNMMLFQRAYQASARVITTADEILDTLINRTGRVGL